MAGGWADRPPFKLARRLEVESGSSGARAKPVRQLCRSAGREVLGCAAKRQSSSLVPVSPHLTYPQLPPWTGRSTPWYLTSLAVETTPSSDEQSLKSGRELIQLGAASTAATIGAVAGTALGPPGSIAGAALGPTMVRFLSWAGRTMKSRMLSPSEEVRIGSALYVALKQIEERQDAGELPRSDGLFDPDADPRGILEGTLLTAARSYDEKKIPFVGAFYASFVFEEKVSINQAHFLLRLVDRMTYHDMCILAYFADSANDEDRTMIQVDATEEGKQMSQMLLAEIGELASTGLLGIKTVDGGARPFGSAADTIGGELTLGLTSLGELTPTDLGHTLVRMANLEKLPEADRRAIGVELQNDTD